MADSDTTVFCDSRNQRSLPENDGSGDDSVTDDGMVMETYGIRGVRMIKGSYENMKITTPEDMLLGEAILKGRSTER